jgi:hypothetical protein
MNWCDHGRAEALYGQGDLKAAHAVTLAVEALCEQIGEQWLMEWANPLLSWLEADLGLDQAARDRAEAALRGVDEAGHLVAQCFARHARAYAHLHLGEWAAAAALYDQCAALWQPTDNRLARLMIGPSPALAQLGLGQLEAAARLAGEYRALAQAAESGHRVGCARRVEGMVLAAQGQTAAAAAALDEAVDALEQSDSRLELGRALSERGRLRAATAAVEAGRSDLQRSQLRAAAGAVEAGRNDLQRALALFELCGAARDCERAALSLAR